MCCALSGMPTTWYQLTTWVGLGATCKMVCSESLFCCLMADVLRWLYQLFVGMDANFRLKRLVVSNDDRDPGLNQGTAYVVEETAYKKFLEHYGPLVSSDSSTCSNHDAIKSASIRGGKGYSASGLGSVVCTRHDMKRPQSVGDLQKGERYVSNHNGNELH